MPNHIGNDDKIQIIGAESDCKNDDGIDGILEKKIYNTPVEWIKYIPKFLSSKSENIWYDCPFCKDITLKLLHFQDHLTVFHIDKFFVQKLGQPGKHWMKRHCKKLMKIEINRVNPALTGVETTSDLGTEVPKLVCQYCKNETFKDFVGFKRHFILNHFMILEEQIIALMEKSLKPAVSQESSNPTNLPTLPAFGSIISNISLSFCKEVKVQKKKFTKEKQFRCVVCSRRKNVVHTKRIIEKHFTSFHPELFLSSQKFPNVSDVHFQINCINMMKHEAICKIENSMIQCSFCTYSHHDKAEVHYHLFLEHYEILKERIVQYQERIQDIFINQRKCAILSRPPSSSLSKENSLSVKPLDQPCETASLRAEKIIMMSNGEENCAKKRTNKRKKYLDFRDDSGADSNSSSSEDSVSDSKVASKSDGVKNLEPGNSKKRMTRSVTSSLTKSQEDAIQGSYEIELVTEPDDHTEFEMNPDFTAVISSEQQDVFLNEKIVKKECNKFNDDNKDDVSVNHDDFINYMMCEEGEPFCVKTENNMDSY